MQVHIHGVRDDVQIPLAQRRPPPRPLAALAKRARDRNAAIKAAHATGAYSYQQIAEHFGIHFTTVGRIVRAGECMRCYFDPGHGPGTFLYQLL